MSAEMTPEAPKTLSVPHAGKRYFALSRGASYAAAARGDLPTIRIGRKLRVPIIAVERMLERAGTTGAVKRPTRLLKPRQGKTDALSEACDDGR